MSETHFDKNTLQTKIYAEGICTKPLDNVNSLFILNSVYFWAFAAVLMWAYPSSA